MMTYLTPFERTGYDLFRSMRDWENEFFGEKLSLIHISEPTRH